MMITGHKRHQCLACLQARQQIPEVVTRHHDNDLYSTLGRRLAHRNRHALLRCTARTTVPPYRLTWWSVDGVLLPQYFAYGCVSARLGWLQRVVRGAESCPAGRRPARQLSAHRTTLWSRPNRADRQAYA